MSIKEMSTGCQEALTEWRSTSLLRVFPFGVDMFNHHPYGVQKSPDVGEEKSERPMKGFPDCKATYAKQNACTKRQ